MYSFDQRLKESSKVIEKFPDRIPVICERDSNSTNVPLLTKKKFLIPKELSLAQFIFVIRKNIKLSKEKALFIFINNILPPVTLDINSVYIQHKDKDNFLYIKYSGENTFGCNRKVFSV